MIAHNVGEDVASSGDDEQIGALLIGGHAVDIDRGVPGGFDLASGRCALAQTTDMIDDGVVLEEAACFGPSLQARQ